ncbi:MAG: UDP-N-acetylmuramoyl-L-alanine--D-glutamate ligase [Candidatus Omnitrophica bacterium]|nr:UDP-N-acetylmuramoyl-L-alanine--D-glutamate ligase [Candidatus Omnitrophota bacterium]
MQLKDKKVLVVGLGRSGVAAAKLLMEKEARVSITDRLESQKTRENAQELKKQNISEIEIGRHTEKMVLGQDLVVSSPGVPLDSLPLVWARNRGIPVIGEIELAFCFCPAPVIAITGTNGKTTVTTLVGEIFRAAARKCVVCGNIGNPFTREVRFISEDHVVVLEISSFQLETIKKFRPKVAVILNVTDDHLDRHADFSQYLLAKCRIFENQTQGDWAIFSEEDDRKFALSEKTKASVLYYSDLTRFSDQRTKNFNSNYLAALTVSSIFDIPEEVSVNVCSSFKGIEHRLERVAVIKDLTFINDSKATNVDSALWALSVLERPIVLIAGGRDKKSNFALIRERLKEKLKAMVLFGEAKTKIEQALGDLVHTQTAVDLEEAVNKAVSLADPGDYILLSPMCASFDMFDDYEARGKVFKQIVHDLAQKTKSKVQSL